MISQIQYSELTSCLTPPWAFHMDGLMEKMRSILPVQKKYQVEIFDNSG